MSGTENSEAEPIFMEHTLIDRQGYGATYVLSRNYLGIEIYARFKQSSILINKIEVCVRDF